MKKKYTIKQVSKGVNPNTNKVTYVFQFMLGKDPVIAGYAPKTKMDEQGRPILDDDNKLQWDNVPVPRQLSLEFDPGTAKTTIQGVLKRQILELQLQDEARDKEKAVKVGDGPEIGEVGLD